MSVHSLTHPADELHFKETGKSAARLGRDLVLVGVAIVSVLVAVQVCERDVGIFPLQHLEPVHHGVVGNTTEEILLAVAAEILSVQPILGILEPAWRKKH